MELTFAEAKPVERTAGRPAEPNPFEDEVKKIALKVDKDGDAIARTTVIALPVDKDKEAEATARTKLINKVTLFLKNAGDACEPAVTVNRNMEFSRDGKTLTLTFWTSRKIRRPRKTQNDAPQAGTSENTTEPVKE